MHEYYNYIKEVKQRLQLKICYTFAQNENDHTFNGSKLQISIPNCFISTIMYTRKAQNVILNAKYRIRYIVLL